MPDEQVESTEEEVQEEVEAYNAEEDAGLDQIWAEFSGEEEAEAESEPESKEEEKSPESNAKEEEQSSEETQDKPDPKQDAWDKNLQRIQQAAATFERAAATMEREPTAQNEAKAEKAKSRLDELLGQSSDDIDPYESIKVVAAELKESQEKSSRGDTELNSFVKAQAAALEQAQQQLHKLTFATDHPDLKDQYDSLREKLVEKVKPLAEIGGGEIPDAVWNKLVDDAWTGIISEASASVESKEKRTDDKVKTPRGTKPVKSKSTKSHKAPEDPAVREVKLLDQMWDQFRGD